MKTEILRALEAYSDIRNTLTEIRLDLVGAVLNKESLINYGWQLICKYDDAQVYEMILDTQELHHEKNSAFIRLWFSEKMHLREIRLYKLDGAGVRKREEIVHKEFNQLLACLKQSVVVPAADRAEDEWGLITDQYILENDAPDFSVAKKQAIILVALISSVFSQDKALVARGIICAARFPQYCPDIESLVAIALEAVKLGMPREATILIREIMERDDIEHHVFNTIGCIMHYLEKRDAAAGCFLHALTLCPSNEEYSNNLWLEARQIFPIMLRNGNYDTFFSLAQSTIISGFTGTELDKANTLCLIGMAYEAKEDPDEAKRYYQEALGTCDSCKPAQASLRRLDWADTETQRRAFNQLVTSFPDLPEERDTGDAVPIIFTDGDSHGNHWATVTDDVKTLAKEVLPTIFEQGIVKYTTKPTINSMSQTDGLLIYYLETMENEHFSIVCLNSHDKSAEEKRVLFESAYPVGVGGKINRLAVNRFLEWPGNIEGQIQCNTLGSGRSVTFFAPYYAHDKEIISMPCECEFELFGFAQKISPAQEQKFVITEGPLLDLERQRIKIENPDDDPENVLSVIVDMDKKMSYLLPSTTYPDDYEFRGIVNDTEWFAYRGIDICKINITFMGADEKSDLLEIDLFAGRHILGDYTPCKGDAIEGLLWLQGYLHSDQIGQPYIRDSHNANLADFFDLDNPSIWRGITKVSDFQIRALHTVYPHLEGENNIVCAEIVLDAIACDPEVFVELKSGEKLYISIRGYVADEPDHSTRNQEWKAMRLAYAEQRGFRNCRFVEVIFGEMGKGYKINFLGLNELLDEINANNKKTIEFARQNRPI